MLMRNGTRALVFKALTTSFIGLLSRVLSNSATYSSSAWRTFHYIYDSFIFDRAGLLDLTLSNFKKIPLKYGNTLSLDGINFNRKSTLTYKLFESIKNYDPIFSFYIRKVDKNVRKNSRGKSGKYMII
jgi:hypothetical protein